MRKRIGIIAVATALLFAPGAAAFGATVNCNGPGDDKCANTGDTTKGGGGGQKGGGKKSSSDCSNTGDDALIGNIGVNVCDNNVDVDLLS